MQPKITASQVSVSVAGLSDALITAPSNGQALVFNGTDWVNGSAAAPAVGALSDVTLTSPANADVLTYNGSRWVNSPVPTSGGTTLDWVVVGGTTDADFATAVTAINALPRGGILYVPAGLYTLTQEHIFTKPVTVIGEGCSGDANTETGPTTIQQTSLTSNTLTFNADPWECRDFHLQNTGSGTPSAGCGIYSPVGMGHKLNRITVKGFWINIQTDKAEGCFASQTVTIGPVHYAWYFRNVTVPDGGDQGIVDCQIDSGTYNSAAGIRWESGGGLRMTNCKFNGGGGGEFTNAIDIEIVDGSVTSDFVFSNSSVENCTGSAIKMRNAGSGTLSNVKITGIQFSNYGSSVPAIDIQATGTGVFDRLILDDLIFAISSSSAPCINIANVDNVKIGLIAQLGHSEIVAATGTTNMHNVNAQFHTEALTDGATINIDLANSEGFRVTLGGNRTLANPTNLHDNHTWQIRVKQDGTGSRTLAFGSMYKKASSYALSTAAGAEDILSFQYDATENTIFVATATAFA